MALVTPMKPNTIGIYSVSSPVDSSQAPVGTPTEDSVQAPLEIFVVYTSPKETSRALRAAAGLANQLGAQIKLVRAYEVSYQLPLNRPPVATKFLEEQLVG